MGDSVVMEVPIHKDWWEANMPAATNYVRCESAEGLPGGQERTAGNSELFDFSVCSGCCIFSVADDNDRTTSTLNPKL